MDRDVVTNRSKSRNTDGLPTHIKWWIKTPTGEPTVGSAQWSSIGTDETIAYWSTPGHRKAISQGQIIMGDMLMTRTSRDIVEGSIQQGPFGHATAIGVPGTIWIYSGDFPSRFEGAVAPHLPGRSQDLSQLRDLAIIKAYAKMNDAPVLTGELLATLDQTLSMLRRPFASSAKLFSRIIRVRNYNLWKVRRTARNVAKANADAWLEARYGMLPLFLDMKNIVASFEEQIALGTKRLVFRGGESSGYKAEKDFLELGTASGEPFMYTGDAKLEQSWRASAGVIVEQTIRQSSDKVAADYGLTASSLPATIYELIPWSFVADWFINIGDWIKASTPRPDMTVLGSWVTSVEETTRTFGPGTVILRQDMPPLMDLTGPSGRSVNKTLTVKRLSNPSLPSLPTLQVKSLSALRSADALALAAGEIVKQLKQLKH